MEVIHYTPQWSFKILCAIARLRGMRKMGGRLLPIGVTHCCGVSVPAWSEEACCSLEERAGRMAKRVVDDAVAMRMGVMPHSS